MTDFIDDKELTEWLNAGTEKRKAKDGREIFKTSVSSEAEFEDAIERYLAYEPKPGATIPTYRQFVNALKRSVLDAADDFQFEDDDFVPMVFFQHGPKILSMALEGGIPHVGNGPLGFVHEFIVPIIERIDARMVGLIFPAYIGKMENPTEEFLEQWDNHEVNMHELFPNPEQGVSVWVIDSERMELYIARIERNEGELPKLDDWDELHTKNQLKDDPVTDAIMEALR